MSTLRIARANGSDYTTVELRGDIDNETSAENIIRLLWSTVPGSTNDELIGLFGISRSDFDHMLDHALEIMNAPKCPHCWRTHMNFTPFPPIR